MAATLRQIAEQSSVSTALVSRVLNNKPGVWASEETRQRIVETARALNYQPSASAQALVSGRTMQLAICSVATWHEGRSGRLLEISGVIDAASQHGYRVLVLPSPETKSSRTEFEALLNSKICDGLCLYAEQTDTSLYAWLQEFNIPFVIIGTPDAPDLPYADIDNYDYAYTSVQWLQAHGHEHIAWSVLRDEIPTEHHTRELKRGYVDAMKRKAPGKKAAQPPVYCEDVAEIAPLIGQPGAPTAVIVRGLANTMRWKLSLELQGHKLSRDFAIMAHLDPTEMAFLKQGDLDQGVICHLHDPRQVGSSAGKSLIQWIEQELNEQPSILIKASAAFCC